MNHSQVLLIKLSHRLPADVKTFLASMLMSELMQAVRNRMALPPEKRHQFCIYLNGYQDLLHTEDYLALQPQTHVFDLALDLAALLPQTESLNIALTVAHQERPNPSQAAQIRLAAWLPLAHTVCFQLSAANAQACAPEFVEPTAGTGKQQETDGAFSATPVEDIWGQGHAKAEIMDIRSRYFWLVALLRTHPHEQYFQFDPSTIPHLHADNPVQLQREKFADWKLYRSSAEMLKHGITCLNTYYTNAMRGKYDRRKPIDEEELRIILEIVTNLGGVLGFRPTMIPCIPEAKQEELARRMQARKLQEAKTLLQHKQEYLDQLRRSGGIDYESKWWQLEVEMKQLRREIAYPASFYPGVHVFPPYPTVQELQDLKNRAIAEGMSPQDAENLITWRTRPYLPNEETRLQELIRVTMDLIADADAAKERFLDV